MNKLESWVTLLSSFGIVAGLILVAYQISQTNSALERESREFKTATEISMNEMYNEFRGHLLEHMDIWERGGRDEPLDSTEQAIYDELTFGYFWLEIQGAMIIRTRAPENGESVNEHFSRQVLDRIYNKPGHEAQFQRFIQLPGSQGDDIQNFAKTLARVRTEYEIELQTKPLNP